MSDPHVPRGTSDPHVPRGTSDPHVPRGTSDPHVPRGTSDPHVPRGTSDPHVPRGTSDPHVPRGTSDPHVPLALFAMAPACHSDRAHVHAITSGFNRLRAAHVRSRMSLLPSAPRAGKFPVGW